MSLRVLVLVKLVVKGGVLERSNCLERWYAAMVSLFLSCVVLCSRWRRCC